MQNRWLHFGCARTATDHSRFWGRLTGKRLLGSVGAEHGLVGVIADITARVEAKHFEQFRGHVLEMMAQGESLPSILHAIAQGVERLMPGALCSVALLDEQGPHLVGVVAPSLPPLYVQALQGLDVGSSSVACASTGATGKRVVVEDLRVKPSRQSHHTAATEAGLLACWAQPVLELTGAMLMQLGCGLAQGFGIARPMPAQDLPTWLQTWRPDPSWASARSPSP